MVSPMSTENYTTVVNVVKGQNANPASTVSDHQPTNDVVKPAMGNAVVVDNFALARRLAERSRELAGHAVEYARLVDEFLDGFEAGRGDAELDLVADAAIGMAGALRLTWDELVVMAECLGTTESDHA